MRDAVLVDAEDSPGLDALQGEHAQQLVGLVLEDEEGRRIDAEGPLLASVTSVDDNVTRWMIPFSMIRGMAPSSGIEPGSPATGET